jgi:hypothetical protein
MRMGELWWDRRGDGTLIEKKGDRIRTFKGFDLIPGSGITTPCGETTLHSPGTNPPEELRMTFCCRDWITAHADSVAAISRK